VCSSTMGALQALAMSKVFLFGSINNETWIPASASLWQAVVIFSCWLMMSRPPSVVSSCLFSGTRQQ